MATVPMSIKIDSTYKDRLNHLASTRRRSSHALAKEAIERFIEEEEEQERALREAIASHEEYLETGMRITLDELDDWMATWGTDHEKELPACHK